MPASRKSKMMCFQHHNICDFGPIWSKNKFRAEKEISFWTSKSKIGRKRKLNFGRDFFENPSFLAKNSPKSSIFSLNLPIFGHFCPNLWHFLRNRPVFSKPARTSAKPSPSSLRSSNSASPRPHTYRSKCSLRSHFSLGGA